MKITINDKTFEKLSKIEIEEAYEVTPDEGEVIRISLYNLAGEYRQTVDVRDFEHCNIVITEKQKLGISQEQYEDLCDYMDEQIDSQYISANYIKQSINLGGLARIKDRLRKLLL